MGLDPGVFGGVFAALYAAHQVADHWVQSQHQADHKGRPGLAGHIACAMHVATYSLTCLAAVGALVWLCGLSMSAAPFVAGMTVNAVTHYIADRRRPLAWLAKVTLHAKFYALGAPRSGFSHTTGRAFDDNPSLGTGAYALDQSFHITFLAVSAALIAGGVA